MIVEKMTDLIGNTPMIKIPQQVTGLRNVDLYAKLEMMNPFGSVKDRTAWGMVKDDLPDLIAGNKTIYENSSGNTAKSLQAIANANGIRFKLVSALAKVPEQKEVLQIMGAEIEEIATASDCFDPTDPNDPQYLIQKRVAENPDFYFPSQFTNRKNPAYHEETTAQEILNDLPRVDYFFGGLGTTGSSLGISEKLRKECKGFKAIGVTAGHHQFIPGIRSLDQMMESTLFQKDYYDRIFSLSEQDAVDGMMTLIDQCAILCGPSSGANFFAALQYLKEIDNDLPERKTAVFIVCDRMEWYVSYVRARRPELFGENKKQNSVLGYQAAEHQDVPCVMPDNLLSWQQENPGAIIIDTRAAQSFDLIKIPGSISMPEDVFIKWIDGRNPFPPGQAVLIVCAVGEKSRHYAAYLQSIGAKAYNLDGGMMVWADHYRDAA